MLKDSEGHPPFRGLWAPSKGSRFRYGGIDVDVDVDSILVIHGSFKGVWG